MKFTRERFQNGSLRRVPLKTGPDVWEFEPFRTMVVIAMCLGLKGQ